MYQSAERLPLANRSSQDLFESEITRPKLIKNLAIFGENKLEKEAAAVKEGDSLVVLNQYADEKNPSVFIEQ